jgi:hypothetical protein
MKDLDWKFILYLDNLPKIRCKYFCGDEEPCLRATGDGWLACNCYGDVDDCDLPGDKR